MLDSDRLVELYREHRGHTVLSVYLDADQHDFGERGKWRLALRNLVAEERKHAADTGSFDRALGHVEAVLEPEDRHFLAGRGWVGFATADELLHAEGVPLAMPDLVRWERGLRVAPYARALERPPVVVALIDSRRARLLRYESGGLTDRARLHSDTYLGDLTDMGVPKRASDHSGVRGKTATDAAQRFLEVERDRLVARAAEEIGTEAGARGLIVLGGTDRVVSALAKALSHMDDARLVVDGRLSFDDSDAEIRGRVERAVSELTERGSSRVVESLVDLARSGGDGTVGAGDVERALIEKRVDTLVISESFRRGNPDLADHMEGTAFEQGATVREVSGSAAERLDDEAGGVGALLRYRVRTSREELTRVR